jgi:hypothetical protein
MEDLNTPNGSEKPPEQEIPSTESGSVTPEEKDEAREKEIDAITVFIQVTVTEISRVRKELGLPATSEEAPSVLAAREKLRKLNEEINGDIYLLAAELSRNPEPLAFPGIEPDALERIRAADAEYPGLTTPIDEIISRCQSEGIKVVFGKDPSSTNVFILPAKSTDIEADSIVPKTLNITDGMDERIKRLIILDRERQNRA